MPAAIIGGAIAAVGAVGSAVISSKGASNAAKATQAGADKASDTQTQIYNALTLAPWQQSGLRANSAINAMLGLNGDQQQQLPPMNGGQGYPTQQPNQAMQVGADYGYSPNQSGGQYGMGGNDYRGEVTNSDFFTQRFGPTAQSGGQQMGGQQGMTTQGAQNAFGQYIKNSDYGFQFGQGSNALNSGYAGAGTLQSGAAMKAMEKYRQDLQSGYRNEYMNALGNQQAVGFSAASAQAGVGQNYANSIGNIAMQNGANQANASLVKSANVSNAIGSVANIAGNLYGRYG
jgi:hypothetical protein